MHILKNNQNTEKEMIVSLRYYYFEEKKRYSYFALFKFTVRDLILSQTLPKLLGYILLFFSPLFLTVT